MSDGNGTGNSRGKYNTAKDLREFAEGIEAKLRIGSKPTTMQNLVCRLLTGKDAKVAASLAGKWVEWRYGKPGQPSSPDLNPLECGNLPIPEAKATIQ